jgi:hypothetical protein
MYNDSADEMQTNATDQLPQRLIYGLKCSGLATLAGGLAYFAITHIIQPVLNPGPSLPDEDIYNSLHAACVPAIVRGDVLTLRGHDYIYAVTITDTIPHREPAYTRVLTRTRFTDRRSGATGSIGGADYEVDILPTPGRPKARAPESCPLGKQVTDIPGP